MSLHRDLLEQARHLAQREPRRPRQASLRRAISATYYAAFHLLAADGAQLLSAGSRVAELRRLLTRAFDHAEMLDVCRAVARGQFPPKVVLYIPAVIIPGALQGVALRFCELQEARHSADYDIGPRYTRATALDHVSRCQQLMDDWETVRHEPAGRIFLTALFAVRKVRA